MKIEYCDTSKNKSEGQPIYFAALHDPCEHHWHVDNDTQRNYQFNQSYLDWDSERPLYGGEFDGTWQGPDWYRFAGDYDSGNRLRVGFVEPNHCSTRDPYYLEYGSIHPEFFGEIKPMKACESVWDKYAEKLCQNYVMIEALNCGPYFVYNLKGINGRYCIEFV